uniref:Uncharacterized protein n=1 Tax=Oryza glumipatula TaxID=40148 RepID=A0A0E0A7S8_9ORYZ
MLLVALSPPSTSYLFLHSDIPHREDGNGGDAAAAPRRLPTVPAHLAPLRRSLPDPLREMGSQHPPPNTAYGDNGPSCRRRRHDANPTLTV